MQSILLGIDGGGTRTRAVLIQATSSSSTSGSSGFQRALQLRELGRGESGSCNHYSVGWDAALHALAAAASQALGQAQAQAQDQSQVRADSPDGSVLHDLSDARIAWGLGIAGAVSPLECAEWKQRLQVHLGLPHARVEVGDDALAAQSGAFAGKEGAILIAGTGAAAFARDAHGRTARADGLGPLLGDRGSGYRIGEAALRAVTLHHDLHRDNRDNQHGSADAQAGCPILHRLVLEHFGVESVHSLVPIVYAPAWAKDRAAALAPVAARAALCGDSTARAILERAGTELAHTAHAVMRPLDLRHVALFGGVLDKIPLVRHAFERVLSDILPRSRAISPRYDAAVGAALLALEPEAKSGSL